MILEHAPLQVTPGKADEFEAAFVQAKKIISAECDTLEAVDSA